MTSNAGNSVPGDWRQSKADDYIETKEENDLVWALRARKNKQRIVLTKAERQMLVGILRRKPHLRNASQVGLEGMTLSLI